MKFEKIKKSEEKLWYWNKLCTFFWYMKKSYKIWQIYMLAI